MFRLTQWLRRSSPGSRRAARGPCRSRLELERLDDRILLSASTPAVINYQDGAVTHENVVVTGTNGDLYLDYWNGTKWDWVTLGNGVAISFLACVGLIAQEISTERIVHVIEVVERPPRELA